MFLMKYLNLEKKIEEVKNGKIKAIKSQNMKKLPSYRDMERKLQEELEKRKETLGRRSKINREIVTEENVAEVVAMMTGIPVQTNCKE